MAQDIRELFEKERKSRQHQLEQGHETRFQERLEDELPSQQKWSFKPWYVAASVVLLIGVSVVGLQQFKGGKEVLPTKVVNTTEDDQKTNNITLGSISPELKKVEDYYVTSINYEISRIDLNDDNRQLIDSYMKKLAELDEEYKHLTEELNRVGPNSQNVEALINNLQLKLQLLQQLQEKLQELKDVDNETIVNFFDEKLSVAA